VGREKDKDRIVCVNRRARFNFTIEETFEAGLVLVGSEGRQTWQTVMGESGRARPFSSMPILVLMRPLVGSTTSLREAASFCSTSAKYSVSQAR